MTRIAGLSNARGPMMRRGSRHLLFAVLALAAVPTSAQLSFPSEPPAPGQTLLEWSDPPILKHDIPPARRDDLTSCAEAHETRLEEVALTCWPVLQAYKLFIRMDFAAGEPSGDLRANRRLALDYADQLIDLIGEPAWPLQTHILMKTYHRQAFLLEDEQQWEAALAANAKEIAAIEALGGYDRDFRMAFALAKRTDLLLGAGQRNEARAVLEQARPLLTRPNGERNGWAFSDHNEAVVKDAIRQGDLAYAETTLDRYLDYVRGAPKGMQFGSLDALDLKLYLVAGRKDVPATLHLLDERMALLEGRFPCFYGGVLFPYVLAPIRDVPAIAARIDELQCPPRVMAKLAQTPETGIISNRGEVILPKIPQEGLDRD